jgi:hypothetical protein
MPHPGEKGIVATTAYLTRFTTPTPITTPTSPPKKTAPSTPQFQIDLSTVLNQVIAGVVAGILLTLGGVIAGWLITRSRKRLVKPPLKNKEKRQALAQYLLQERTRILDILASGSSDLLVEDIVSSNELFIPLPWKFLGDDTQPTDLIEYLVNIISNGKRILLLGEAGQGKTIALKRVFSVLTDHFLSNQMKDSYVPIYLPLREFTYSTHNAAELLWAHLSDRFPLTFEDFSYLLRKEQLVFLFDGLDEIKGERTQASINNQTTSGVFSYPSILSCRKSFYELYLSTSPIQERYLLKIELQPLELTENVKQRIAAFRDRKQRMTPKKTVLSSEEIIKAISRSPGLRDLARRPLLLTMILDLFTDPQATLDLQAVNGGSSNGSGWNLVKLYQGYTEKWLKNEAMKPGSILRWNEKELLVQEFAQFIYAAKVPAASAYGLYETVTFTQEDMISFLERVPLHLLHHQPSRLLEDLCTRTFLIASDGINYYFIHKSFHEYYIARCIFDHIRRMGNKIESITQVLQEFIPVEIANFLEGMLTDKSIPKYEKDQMTQNLIRVYEQNSANGAQSTMIREHASYCLACLKTLEAVQFLEQAYKNEPDKWVQRGIMVRLAYSCNRADILNEYINFIYRDPEAASINLGYHLVYYGDQALEEGYFDQGGQRCSGTLQAIFRHLNNESYRKGWLLDLLTLRMLIETRGVTILQTSEDYLPFLKNFLTEHPKGEGRTFQQEKRRLQTILRKVSVL